MSLADLVKAYDEMPRGLITKGSNWRQLEMDLPAVAEDNSKLCKMIINAIQTIFDSKTIYTEKPVIFWYDEMAGMGKSYGAWDVSPWDGIYIFGVFFRYDIYREPQVCHMFLRKLDGFMGSLDQWKDDINMPDYVRQYSVCAVIPEEYEYKGFELRDAHNSCVTQYRWRDIMLSKVDVNYLADYIREYGSTERDPDAGR